MNSYKSRHQKSYSDKQLVKYIVEKNLQYINSGNDVFNLSNIKIFMASAIASKNSNKINILDFGGGGGSHFYDLAVMFPSLKIDYTVIETSEMVRSSIQKLPKKIRYFDNLKDPALKNMQFDLIIVSSALQYVEDLYRILSEIINLKHRYLYITRTILNESDIKVEGIQRSYLFDNGPGSYVGNWVNRFVFYPIKIEPKSNLLDFLNNNYKKVVEFNEEKHVIKINGNFYHMYGFFCTSK
jgi:putative methyltransferase (TIGR04325 family)